MSCGIRPYTPIDLRRDTRSTAAIVATVPAAANLLPAPAPELPPAIAMASRPEIPAPLPFRIALSTARACERAMP